MTTAGQLLPHLIAARLPGTLAGSNPLAPGQTAGPNATSGSASTSAPNLHDPAYAVAVTMRGQVSHFYDYLGGESGTVDWTKFAKSSEDAPSGVVYLLANFNGQKANMDVTNTEPNKKVIALLNTLIKVSWDPASQCTSALADDFRLPPRSKTTSPSKTIWQHRSWMLRSLLHGRRM